MYRLDGSFFWARRPQGLAKSDARELRPLLKVPELQLLQQLAERHGKTAAQAWLERLLQKAF